MRSLLFPAWRISLHFSVSFWGSSVCIVRPGAGVRCRRDFFTFPIVPFLYRIGLCPGFSSCLVAKPQPLIMLSNYWWDLFKEIGSYVYLCIKFELALLTTLQLGPILRLTKPLLLARHWRRLRPVWAGCLYGAWRDLAQPAILLLRSFCEISSRHRAVCSPHYGWHHPALPTSYLACSVSSVTQLVSRLMSVHWWASYWPKGHRTAMEHACCRSMPHTDHAFDKECTCGCVSIRVAGVY